MKRRNKALESLRCVALLLVVYDHLIGFRNPDFILVGMVDRVLMEPLGLIQYGGALGVSIFFLISGYLLASGVDEGKYTIKKLPRKIWQLYIPMVISYISFFIVQEVMSLMKYEHYFQQFSISDWILGGSLLGYFTNRGDVINGTTWYLVPTFIAYIVVFSFAKLLRLSVRKGFVGIELTLGITVLLGGIVKSEQLRRLFSYNWYIYILLFGLFIYYFEKNKVELKEFLLSMSVNYLMLIVGVYLYMPHYASKDKYIVSVIYAILLLVLAVNINNKYNIQGNKMVTFLSGLSYYIYLVHMPYGSFINNYI